MIGDIKKNNALDNFRNSIAGHISIDYRIASAMYNFTHKPCESGGEKASTIARRLKRKLKTNQNNLEFLLSIKLGKKLTTMINCSIIDFPRLSIQKLKEKIMFGPYQLKQAKSYLNDLLINGHFFSVNESVIKNITDEKLKNNLFKCKIIACQIASRHKRGLKTGTDMFRNVYKVYIAYIPNLNSSKSIKGKIFFQV